MNAVPAVTSSSIAYFARIMGDMYNWAKENGFDYVTVRLYEASLFLSMLPLHMDNVQKTFGFLLNGIKILKEVEECLKD